MKTGTTLKTLIHTETFVTEYFMVIVSLFWIQKKWRSCISALKQNILYVWYLIDESFLSVIFF